jgi:hypothetical protein
MKKRISMSFSIKYAKLSPLMVSEGSLCLQQSGFTRDSCYLHDITVTYVPPLLVFPRSNMKAQLLDSPPPVSITAEWIQKESFTQKFKHSVRFVKPPIQISLSPFSLEEHGGDRLCSGKRSAHCLPSPA